MKGLNLTSLALVCLLGTALTGCASTPTGDLAAEQGDRVSVVASAPATPSTVSAEATAVGTVVSVDPGDIAIAADLAEGLPFVRSQPHKVPPFPLVLNSAVRRYVEAFTEHSEGIEESFRRSQPYLPMMVQVMERHGLPPDLVYLSFAESSFSKKGAGPWQLSKATARRFHLKVNRYIDERRDPMKSTRAAAAYLVTLHDEVDDWPVALVGWNRGERALNRYWSLRGVNYSLLVAHLPYNTRSLLNRFMAVAIIAHQPQRYGLQPVDYTDAVHFRHIRVKGGTRLTEVARHTGVPVRKLRKYNPALLHDRVPPGTSYDLRLPLADSADARDTLRF